MAGRIEALEATACKHDAERERLHRVIERLSCRLDVAEARCAVLEHDRARRGLLATLAGLVPPGLGAVCVDKEFVAL